MKMRRFFLYRSAVVASLAGFLFGLRERVPCAKPLELLGSLLPLDFHIWPLEMV